MYYSKNCNIIKDIGRYKLVNDNLLWMQKLVNNSLTFEGSMTINMDTITNRARIANFVWEKKETSKQNIMKELELSMPTVLQNVNDLISLGVLQEGGAYKSTGGRKAKVIVINEDLGYAAGLDITQNHVSCVIINMQGNIIAHKRVRMSYHNQSSYYIDVKTLLEKMLNEYNIARKKLLGVGISLPGILNSDHSILVRSHALHVTNLNLDFFRKIFDYPVVFENDANSALLSEMKRQMRNTVYFSLSNTVGGALCLDGNIYTGDNSRAGEIGHMVLEKNGKQCYCGKKGCFDAYGSAKVLAEHTDDNLGLFFEKLENGDMALRKVWDEYLEYLAIAVSNMRMLCDCDIILGGYVGAYIDKHLHVLAQTTKLYNLFDQNGAYLKICNNRTEASALGIAVFFLRSYLKQL